MIDQITTDPDWRHLAYGEYADYIILMDQCPCEKSAIGLYVKRSTGKEFFIMCYTCKSFVYADYYAKAMIMWNKKCRHKTGQIK